MIKITTNKGEFTIEMFSEKAPQTTENFEQYVKDGYYDGTIFHRVINNFMIQGGGFESGMTQKKTRDTIDNEANNGIANEVGTVAMARTNDPHSASSQFFINVKDNNFLDHTSPTTSGWGYCVFGKIVDGMDVIDEMKAVDTGSDTGHQDVPVEEIVIIKAEIIED